MNSIAQIQAAKNSELVAFWNANCEVLGKPAIKKFSSNEAAVKRCSELFAELEAKRAAETPAVAVEEVSEPVAAPAPIEAPAVEVVAEEAPAEDEEEEDEEEDPRLTTVSTPFNPLTSIMNAINGTLKVPASMESLPTIRHELSDELAENKSAPAPKRRASNSEGVAASWADGDVRTARLTRNGVRVTIDGATSEFKSVNEAFRHFRLPTSKHIRFRGLLKASATKTLAFEHESKSYLFEVI